MKIIIVGCGKVGYTLAKILAEEKNDVTVIDKEQRRVDLAQNDIDCMGVVGNGAIQSVLIEAGINESDYVIAVTGSDEINILTCLIARKTSDCKTIARIRNPEYVEQLEYIMKELDISLTINPELATAREIARITRYSNSISSDSFFKGRLNLLKVKIPDNSKIIGLQLAMVQKVLNCNVLICIIERGDEIIVPSGHSTIEKGDKIFFVAEHKNVIEFFNAIGYAYKPLNSFMIVGGGRITRYLIEILTRHNYAYNIKVIEIDKGKCESLAIDFPKISIVNADATDKNILKREGMYDVDAFIALTGIDEENIILSLFANVVEKTKVITKINHLNFVDSLKDIHLDSIVNPERVAADMIDSYVRATSNLSDSNIETLYTLCNDRVEGLGFRIRSKSAVTDVPIRELKLKKNVIIAGIYRKGNVIRPNGNDTIKVGDSVVIITKDNKFNDITDIISEQ